MSAAENLPRLTSREELKALLRRHGLRPRKALGQHFLVSETLRHKILEAAELQPGDRVLEIGAGVGTLTLLLLEKTEKVLAVEADRRLCAVLEELAKAVLKEPVKLDLRCEDVRKLDLPALLQPPGWKVVANLPYYLSGPLLASLLELHPLLKLAVLTLQKEVAERILSSPGTPSYGGLSVLSALFAPARLVATAPPHCFYPPPEVHSAVVRLDFLPSPPASFPLLQKTVRAAFAHRRKSLRQGLAEALRLPPARVEEKLRAAGLDPSRRAEEMAPPEFLILAESLTEILK